MPRDATSNNAEKRLAEPRLLARIWAWVLFWLTLRTADPKNTSSLFKPRASCASPSSLPPLLACSVVCFVQNSLARYVNSLTTTRNKQSALRNTATAAAQARTHSPPHAALHSHQHQQQHHRPCDQLVASSVTLTSHGRSHAAGLLVSATYSVPPCSTNCALQTAPLRASGSSMQRLSTRHSRDSNGTPPVYMLGENRC
jgi:hypothetical protein